MHGFRLIAHRIPDAEKHKQLMDGVTLARGGMARKPDSKILWQFTDEYVKGRADVTQVRTQLLKAGDQPMTLELRRAVEEQLAILPIHDAIEVVLSLANAARSRGQWTAAREWFSLATDRYPAHPLSAQAYLWQMKFHASSEHQRRLELGTMPFVRPTEFFEIPANIVQQVSGTDGLASPIKARFRSTDAEREWIGTGLNQEAKLFAMQPLITREPSTQILLNATRLRLGLTADAEKIVSTYARMNSDGTPMMTAISREVALATRQPVKPMLVCEKFNSRPVLDGKLDEAMWSNRTAFSHAPARLGAYGTEVKLGYDDEFLYVGVMCTHPIGEHVPVAETRKYDDDVSPFDRVEIVFDADRDYATYQRLRVDQRGCTAEDLCGDPTWNPKWFVAVTTAPTSWTAEIAIPLSELTTRKPSDRHVWAANVVRVLPGRGVTSLTAPADATPRLEGLGLLEFRAR